VGSEDCARFALQNFQHRELLGADVGQLLKSKVDLVQRASFARQVEVTDEMGPRLEAVLARDDELCVREPAISGRSRLRRVGFSHPGNRTRIARSKAFEQTLSLLHQSVQG
jgi:hypothetical protein